ncbi:Uncharacterized protein involved in outer membrane biogenesis [Bartonella vinsonii]|uniref:Uncharacterized protein involved in outer membrane biogenesis n=1 Tax=Bartonella vinsonii TaxID=33047 RepID=A0A3S4YUK9_BARVI|nr:Uncharacterized protein involved in outer membrane biogenesis [Bartonella vinsonii]
MFWNQCFLRLKNRIHILDREIFDRIGVDIRLSSSQAKVGKFALTNLAAAIQIKNGLGIFDLGHANVFGGSFQSNIEVIPAEKKMRIKGRVSGTSVDIQTATKALGMTPFVQSKANFTMTAETLGSSWSEIFSKIQGKLTLNMSSGRLLGYDLNDLQMRLSKNEQFLLIGNEALSTAFDLWDIQTSFSDGTMKGTESLMGTADWSLSIWGTISFAVMQDLQNEFRLLARLRKTHSSETLCQDVQCLANSLVCPFTFSLNSKEQERGIFLVKKGVYAN